MWFLYIVRCCDGSFYTGISNNVLERIKRHNSGKASKYTRARKPVTLVYSEEYEDKIQALKREAEIKCLSREEKKILIKPRRGR